MTPELLRPEGEGEREEEMEGEWEVEWEQESDYWSLTTREANDG